MGYLHATIGKFLPKSRFARNVAMLSAGSFASQAIAALVTPIATRFYTPADYGVLGVFTSILGVLLVICGGRYELAVTIPEDDQPAANLLALSFLMTLCTAVVAGLALWLLGESFLAKINGLALAPYIWLIPLSLIGGGAYQSLSYWAVRTKSFGELTRTRLNQSIGSSATLLGLGYFHAGPLGLLLGYFMSVSAGVNTLGRMLLKGSRREIRSVTWSDMRALAVRYKQFPMMSMPSALFSGATFFLPPLLLSAFYGTEKAGLFSLAIRIVSIPAALLGAAVTQVYMSETADVARNDRTKLAQMFSSVTIKLLRLSVFVIVFGCVSPYVFGTVFGREWQMAGLYTAFLSVHAAAQLVVAPISSVAVVLERQDLQMAGELTRCLLVTLALVVPHLLGWSADATVALYAATMTVTYVGFYLMYRWVAFNACNTISEVSKQ